MPRLRVNFADVKDFEAVPNGTYPLVLEETSVEQGAKGPYVKWTFSIETGEYANQKQWLNTSLAAPGMVRQTLRALGENIPDDVDDFDFDPDDYLGRRVLGRIAQRTYDGRLVNDIKQLMPPIGAEAGKAKAGAGIR